MGPSPSWTPLLNQRLMGVYPSLYTGNLLTWTGIYSGTVTIMSQQNLLQLIPSPIGQKQCVAILSFSTKKWIISGRHAPNVNTHNGFSRRWRKGLTGPPGRSLMGLTTRALQAPSPLPMKLKQRVILSYLMYKIFAKALKDQWKLWHTDPLQR